jgi:hypothetical protein
MQSPHTQHTVTAHFYYQDLETFQVMLRELKKNLNLSFSHNSENSTHTQLGREREQYTADANVFPDYNEVLFTSCLHGIFLIAYFLQFHFIKDW